MDVGLLPGHANQPNVEELVASDLPHACVIQTPNPLQEDAGTDPAGSGRGGVHQSRVGVDQRYKYTGLGVDHGVGHHRPCDQTSNVQRSAA